MKASKCNTHVLLACFGCFIYITWNAHECMMVLMLHDLQMLNARVTPGCYNTWQWTVNFFNHYFPEDTIPWNTPGQNLQQYLCTCGFICVRLKIPIISSESFIKMVKNSLDIKPYRFLSVKIVILEWPYLSTYRGYESNLWVKRKVLDSSTTLSTVAKIIEATKIP
jgi:hypothetical protein